MTIYFPWGLIAIFVVLYSFYSVNRKRHNKRTERQEHLAEMQEELIHSLKEKNNKEQNDEVSDTTEVE
jgi:Flp pilus assembly protein TadB